MMRKTLAWIAVGLLAGLPMVVLSQAPPQAPANLRLSTPSVAVRTLTVSKTGSGTGTVTGVGIACGADCDHNYADGTVVTLTQSPAGGSLFGGWTGACTGTGNCVVTMSAAQAVAATFTLSGGVAWIPPIGIPAPSFGINESTTDNAFTHWVNNSVACSDSTNGTPANPRCTIPTTFAAGSIAQLRGGPYTLPGVTPTFTASGTVSQPVFLRGPTAGPKVVLIHASDVKSFEGSYFIVENIDTDRVRTSGDHIAIRTSDVHDHPNRNGVESNGTDIVIYNNRIFRVGNQTTPDDRHGVTMTAGTNRVWIVDNDISFCSGDGVQFAHFAPEPGPQNVYIGRNIIHDNVENAVDFKTSNGVIVSQNEMYNHDPSGGSDGTAVLIGSNGVTDAAVNIWIIFNNIHDNEVCVRIEASALVNETPGPAYIVGNVCRDTTRAAIQFDKTGNTVYVVNNTVENADHFLNATFRDQFDIAVFDNIVVGMRGLLFAGNDVQQEFLAIANVSELDRTTFYQDGSPVQILWGNLFTYSSTAEMATFPGGANNRLEDPLFVNRAANDFHLQGSSPAIGLGVEHPIYALFETLFPGQSIRFDFDGVARPQGGSWDRGAYEFLP